MREPGWWYAAEPSPMARLLAPASHIWSRAAERRFVAATPYRARLPVICIGNFTAGGTGKTPLAARIAADLTAIGRTPVVLSRGHGGRIHGPHRVVPRVDTATEVGDEPLLHAARVPVVIARDRAAGARLIEARGVATDVIVMDDGLQNPSIEKDLSIAVVDGTRGLGNGMVMPAGPLRAPLDVQLRRVDVIVVNLPEGADAQANAAAARLRQLFEGPVLTAFTRPAEPLDWLDGLSVAAWAGIGNPGRFFVLLERHGARIMHRTTFTDHELPGNAAVDRLLATADRLGARLVTTEKDLVRLSGGSARHAALRSASRAVPIALCLEPGDTDRLRARMEAVLRPHSAASGD